MGFKGLNNKKSSGAKKFNNETIVRHCDKSFIYKYESFSTVFVESTLTGSISMHTSFDGQKNNGRTLLIYQNFILNTSQKPMLIQIEILINEHFKIIYFVCFLLQKNYDEKFSHIKLIIIKCVDVPMFYFFDRNRFRVFMWKIWKFVLMRHGGNAIDDRGTS